MTTGEEQRATPQQQIATLLLADLDRATALLMQLRGQYPSLVAEQQRLLRSAIESHDGAIVDTQGEALLATFPHALDATLAASQAQRDLTAYPWPENAPFQVRIGVHTGAPARTAHGLVGLDVHRVARLCSAAYGGQILVSATTRAAVDGALPSDLSLRDLGEHRLKDLPVPERLSQLVVVGLQQDFPPVRSLAPRPTVPSPRHEVIGRERDLAACRDLLLRDDPSASSCGARMSFSSQAPTERKHRLRRHPAERDYSSAERHRSGPAPTSGQARMVTVTGPGGSGKTALALHLAVDVRAQFEDGAFFVDLSPVADVALVAESIAHALDVEWPGRRSWLEAAAEAIGERRLLLVVDNVEHLLGAAEVLGDLLARCPKLAMLVTSRDLLRLPVEHGYALAPLALPSFDPNTTLDDLMRSPAVRLFLDRVAEVRPGFVASAREAPIIAEICRRLDGLPLALELAAARARMLTPAALLARLDRRLPLLTGGRRDLPARQQTLRGTIAWSYDLLAPQAQQLFRCLSVFADGWDAGVGCSVAGVDGTDGSSGSPDSMMASLVEKSLLRTEDRQGETRYLMLETIREFAAEQLEASGEEEATRQRHLASLIALAEEAGPHLHGPDQATWLDRVGRERENIRAAERWAAERGDVEGCLRLAAPLWRFWQTRAGANDARERLDMLMRLAPLATATPSNIRAIQGVGLLARVIGEYTSAQSLYERSLGLARDISDAIGEAQALNMLSNLTGFHGDYERGRQLGREGLAIRERHPDLEGLSEALREVGMIEFLDNQLGPAHDLFRRAVLAGQEAGDERAVANASYSLGLVHHLRGELREARRLYGLCIATDRAQGHRASEGSNLCNLGHVAVLEGKAKEATSLLHESLLASHEGGDRRRIAFTLSVVACLMVLEDEYEAALRLDAAALTALDVMKATLAPAMRAQYDQQLALATLALGEARASTARAGGRTLTLEQARAEALDWLAARGGATASDDEETPRDLDLSNAPTLRMVMARR